MSLLGGGARSGSPDHERAADLWMPLTCPLVPTLFLPLGAKHAAPFLLPRLPAFPWKRDGLRWAGPCPPSQAPVAAPGRPGSGRRAGGWAPRVSSHFSRQDLAWAISYYVRFFATYIPFYGVLGAVLLLNFIRCRLPAPPRAHPVLRVLCREGPLGLMSWHLGGWGRSCPPWPGGRAGAERHPSPSRFLESHWFVWVTQMNHIVMEIDREHYRDWFSSQVGRGAQSRRLPGLHCPSAAGPGAKPDRAAGSLGGTSGDSVG